MFSATYILILTLEIWDTFVWLMITCRSRHGLMDDKASLIISLISTHQNYVTE